MRRQLLLFGISGTIAFLIDAGVLQLLIDGLGADPYSARLLSFLCAVLFTWQFNRHLTFAEAKQSPRSLWREWLHYLGAQIGGFAFNYGSYALLLLVSATAREWPVLAVAAGSIAGMVVNFLSAKYLVFRQRAR